MVNVDINVLRTFLELVNTRHFGKTANNMYLTQAAVSARINLLEDHLSVKLFTRHRNNIQLTRQGERLVGYATKMLELWTQATQEVCAPSDYFDLSIAAPKSIWSSQLAQLPTKLFSSHKKLHLTIDSLDSSVINSRLIERTLDFGFVYDPSKNTDLATEPIFNLELAVFSNKANSKISDITNTNFVSIDMGLSFKVMLNRLFPSIQSAVFQAYDWDMVMNYLLQFGGFALLPIQSVNSAKMDLYLVEDGPQINRTVYLAYNPVVISDEIKELFFEQVESLYDKNIL